MNTDNKSPIAAVLASRRRSQCFFMCSSHDAMNPLVPTWISVQSSAGNFCRTPSLKLGTCYGSYKQVDALPEPGRRRLRFP